MRSSLFHFKVFSLAILVTCFTRNKNDDQEAGEHLQMETFNSTNNDEQEVGHPSLHFTQK